MKKGFNYAQTQLLYGLINSRIKHLIDGVGKENEHMSKDEELKALSEIKVLVQENDTSTVDPFEEFLREEVRFRVEELYEKEPLTSEQLQDVVDTLMNDDGLGEQIGESVSFALNEEGLL